MRATFRCENMAESRSSITKGATLAVYRSNLLRQHEHIFKECLTKLDQCTLSLAIGRLEGLVVLLGTFDDAVMQCWPWLKPRLVSHSTNGCVVAGNGCYACTGNEPLELCSPQRVACANDGSVLVADWGNNRLCRWKAGSGEIFAEDPLNFTYGICCDSMGVVYATTDEAVVCVGNVEETHRKEKERPCSLRVSESAGLCDHCGLCSDNLGGLYIADHLNDRVVYSRRLGLLEVVLGPFFSNGESTGRLNCPADVELSSHGELFVADRGGGRVLSCKGNGVATTLVADLAQPYALACRGDLLYVAEFGRNRVLCIQLSCGSVSQFLEIRSPTGLCFDAAGNLYVSERDLNRVVCFEPVVD